MDQFYATLPSDANPEQFPENNSSNWITSLNPPLQLEGEWCVGMSEIHLPRNRDNITEYLINLK